MSYPIQEIEGIGKKHGKALAKAGVKTTARLLKLCCDRKGRNAVAKETGLDPKQLLKWANMADLMRIRGIGHQYAELLEAAGVDTVKELRKRNAENLAAKMAEVQASKRLTRQAPGVLRVEDWIGQADRLDPVITH